MSIQTIYEMPNMGPIKEGSEDYCYPTELIGQTVKYKDNYISFQKTKYDEYPVALVNIVAEIINQEQTDNNYVTKEDMISRIDKVSSEAESSSEDADNKIDNVSNDMAIMVDEINEKIDSVSTQVGDMQSPEGIKKIISQELTAVHDNYEKVIKGLINDKAEELAKDIKDQGNKLDPMNVMLFKKMGMDMTEIVQMAKAGLI
jgi:hypothetical protein